MTEDRRLCDHNAHQTNKFANTHRENSRCKRQNTGIPSGLATSLIAKPDQLSNRRAGAEGLAMWLVRQPTHSAFFGFTASTVHLSVRAMSNPENTNIIWMPTSQMSSRSETLPTFMKAFST